MWIKLEKSEFDPYVINLNETVYDAYLKLLSNREKTLILINDSFMVVGSLTLGDFKRKISYTLDAKILKETDFSISNICNNKFFSKKFDEAAPEFCNHLLVPITKNDKLVSIYRRGSPSNSIKIGEKYVGETYDPTVIAEIGVNHDGNINIAKQLINEAFLAGAHFVKFQHRSLSNSYIDFGGESSSELSTESTIHHLRKVNFSLDQLDYLFGYARKIGIAPLCTPFDLVSLKEVLKLKPVALKIASSDLLNFELIEQAAITNLPIILSTGMHVEEEIISAINFARLHTSKIIILHCVSTYPAESSSLNLRYINQLKRLTGCLVGYSSHDNGNLACITSVALGAVLIEKHITWNRKADGPDHNASSEFNDFKRLCASLLETKNSLGSLGLIVKKLSQGEIINRSNLSKSLYSKRDIKVGQKVVDEDFICRSPGIGIPCSSKKFVVGRVSQRNIKTNDVLYESDFFEHGLSWDRIKSIPKNSKWGIPVRFRDVNSAISTFLPSFIEFHLTYSDLNFSDYTSLDISNCGVKIHAPELFKDNFLLDLASTEKSVREKSIDNIKRTVDTSHMIYSQSAQNTPLDLIINPGGHSSDFFVDNKIRERLFSNLITSFDRIDFGFCNPIIQSMPPYPWHLGGRRYHNLFVKEVDFIKWHEETKLSFCVDFSHSFLAAKFLNRPFLEYLEKILPFSAYFHVADSEGVDGEGLQILDGEINFKDIFDNFLTNKDFEYIPEIWQGHVNDFYGFKNALSKLKQLGW